MPNNFGLSCFVFYLKLLWNLLFFIFYFIPALQYWCFYYKNFNMIYWLNSWGFDGIPQRASSACKADYTSTYCILKAKGILWFLRLRTFLQNIIFRNLAVGFSLNTVGLKLFSWEQVAFRIGAQKIIRQNKANIYFYTLKETVPRDFYLHTFNEFHIQFRFRRYFAYAKTPRCQEHGRV